MSQRVRLKEIHTKLIPREKTFILIPGSEGITVPHDKSHWAKFDTHIKVKFDEGTYTDVPCDKLEFIIPEPIPKKKVEKPQSVAKEQVAPPQKETIDGEGTKIKEKRVRKRRTKKG